MENTTGKVEEQAEGSSRAISTPKVDQTAVPPKRTYGRNGPTEPRAFSLAVPRFAPPPRNTFQKFFDNRFKIGAAVAIAAIGAIEGLPRVIRMIEGQPVAAAAQQPSPASVETVTASTATSVAAATAETEEIPPSPVNWQKESLPWVTKAKDGLPVINADGIVTPDPALAKLISTLPPDWTVVFSPSNADGKSPESGRALQALFPFEATQGPIPEDIVDHAYERVGITTDDPIVTILLDPAVTVIMKKGQGALMFGPPTEKNTTFNMDQIITLDGKPGVLGETQIRKGKPNDWLLRQNDEQVRKNTLYPIGKEGIQAVLGTQPFWTNEQHFNDFSHPDLTEVLETRSFNDIKYVKIKFKATKEK